MESHQQQTHGRHPSLQHPQRPQSPHVSNRSGQTFHENDSDEEQYLSGDDDSDHGINANDSSPRKRQKRPLSVSCELCKQRKVKCDRGQPACGWCTRNGATCEYKERKKPGLRAGYGRELEQRLDRLEGILQQHSRILDQEFARNSNTSIHSEHTTPNDAQLFRSNSHSAPGPTSRAEAALFLQKPSRFQMTQAVDFALNLPPPTPSIHSIHGSDLYQQSLSVATAQPQHTLPQSQQSNSGSTPGGYGANQLESPSLNIDHASRPYAMNTDDDLPPYDLLYGLVDLYFKHINTWCPILHRRTTLDLLFGSGSLEEADRILLHAIVATTIRFSTDARLTKSKSQQYHDISKQKVLLFGLENSSVKSLQALVILALDLVGSSNGPPGWNILALITRSVVQLGLAVETSSSSVSPHYPSIYTLRAMVLPDSKDWIEEESRRRLFWMVYLLDRYATIATAFEFALSESEIDRQLPCRDAMFDKNASVETRWFRTPDRTQYYPDRPENMGSFAYYIEILGIFSRIHTFLKRRIDISALEDVERWQAEYRKLDNMLTEWKFNLPPQYGNMAKLYQTDAAKTINPGWVMLHATYHTAVIRLHSSAAYPTTRSPIFAPSYSASQRCHGAVENIAALTDWVVQSNMLSKLGPPFIFTLWVSARLLLVHGSTIEHKLSHQIHVFVETLRSMGLHWEVAQRYTDIIQRVLDEYKDNEEHALASGERTQGDVVKILADMRRTAYDLDFLISRQPRRGAQAGMPKMATPARTPAANELEYLDVFDFFNFPRLPVDMNTSNGNNVGQVSGISGRPDGEMKDGEGISDGTGAGNNEFNITNFMVDANADWLFKNSS